MKNLERQFRDFLALNKITLRDEQIFLFNEYIKNLLDFNKKINLISRRDEENICERHIIPCIVFSALFKNFNQLVLDIGTGGGLPGIPFAIINRNSRIILIDSIKKKISAVNEIVQKLGLQNIETIWTRVEDKNFIKKFSKNFDLIISRATAELETLIEYSIPIIKSDKSKLAAMKGGNELDAEILKAKKRFNYIAIQKIPLIYLPENPENINKKFAIIVERINGRK